MLGGLAEYKADEIWAGLAGDARWRWWRGGTARPEEARVGGVHEPESAAELAGLHGDSDRRAEGLEAKFDFTVVAERLREVNALIGFTRVEPPEEAKEGGAPPPRAPLANGNPEWIPATEVRGEGIFLRFNSQRLAEWLRRPERESARGCAAARVTRHFEPRGSYRRRRTTFPGSPMCCCTRSLTF